MTTVLSELIKLNKNDDKVILKKKNYSQITDRFSWSKSASLFMLALENIEPTKRFKKIAIFCPSPSSYSAVGKYAFLVHGELSRLYDIDYFIEAGQTEYEPTRPNILEYAANYYPANYFHLKESNYDEVIYNIGNSEFHVQTILNSLKSSANAIIHDTKLKGIFDYMLRNGFITDERKQYEEQLDSKFNTKLSSRLTSIATNQKTIFCHSSYSKTAINEISLAAKQPIIKQVILPVGLPKIELLKTEQITISFAGIISEDKGINLIAEVSQIPGVKIKVFGFGVLGDSPLLQSLGHNVEVIKDLSDKEFQDTLRLTDILINYRVNYNGETSLSTLEAMRYGVAVLVNDIGWFSELPDSTVVKVKSELDVIEAIRLLIKQPEIIVATGKAARKYLAREYTYAQYANLIQEGLEVR
jgi:glycosyltransferase involved in cell wall biosynthesis